MKKLFMRDNKIILILFIIALLLYVIPVALKEGVLLVPDEAAYLSTARNLMNKSSFYIQNLDYSYNEEFNTNIFGQKFLNYIPKKGMVEQYPFGLTVLLAIFGKLFNKYIHYLVPFIGAIGIVLFYLLNKLYFNREQALYASLLLMVMPGYFYWSTFTMSDVPSVVFFILGLYILETYFRSPKMIWLIIGSIIFGFTVCFRYSNFILPAVIFLYFCIKRFKTLNFKKELLIVFISFFIPILLLMVYHYYVYHHPFMTGYHLRHAEIRSMLGLNTAAQTKPVISVMHMNAKFLIKHILGFPLQTAVSLPYVLFGIIASFYLWKRHRHLFYLISTTFLLLVLFNANIGRTFGSSVEEMTLHSSYLRYTLLSFVLLIIPVALFIYEHGQTKLLKLGILSVLLFSSIFNNFSSVPDNNLRINYQVIIPKIQHEKKVLFENIPEQSVIFSKYAAKYLLPERATVMPDYVSLRKLNDMIKVLLKNNINVYYLDDSDRKDVANFLQSTTRKLLNKKIKLYQIISASDE